MKTSFYRFKHHLPLVFVAGIVVSVMAYLYTSDAKAAVIQEKDGLVAIEAENFTSQTLDSVRKWYIFTPSQQPSVQPDEDATDPSTASNNAYIEILPDKRVDHSDPLIEGDTISEDPGKMGVLTYEVNFTNTGRYYIWGRTNAPGPEDNGLHYGIDGTWPATSKKAQWCGGGRNWTWKNHQRVDSNHCGTQGTIYLDINTPGTHTIMVSMREDGMELDKIVMTKDKNYVPQGLGPTSEGNPTVTSAPNPTATPVVGGNPTGPANVSGELRRWHNVMLTFDGPQASETDANNPFLNYRLNVEFTAPSGKKITVPGYFAADGNAAESSATSGNKWRVHLAPDEVGTWSYKASFRQGTDVAVSLDANAGSPTSFDGASGTFPVQETNKGGKDFRGKGMLKYINQPYLQFAGTGEYYVKAGPDSPENLLAYEDFDNTPNNEGHRKSYSPHAGDWKSGDPDWKGGKGRELIGAINYLASEDVNVIAFLTMNIKGDDKNVFPYVIDTDFKRIDVSKVDQWEKVFSHADAKGLMLNFKTQENENDQLLNNGGLGTERKLYYRELVARFGHHLAVTWNLGEESTNTTSERKSYAQFFHDIDPYDHHIVIHNNLKDLSNTEQNNLYDPLINGQSFVTGTSFQTEWNNVIRDTETWVNKTRNSSKPWIIANDEQAPASYGVPPDSGNGTSSYNQDSIRKVVLWGNLMHGGAGVEYYFGYSLPHSDLTLQDFRSRDRMWDYNRHALTFFDNHIPFWLMIPDKGVTSNTSDYVMAKSGDIYAIYLPNGGTTNITLPVGTYSVKWFDPRSGGGLQNGSVTQVNGGSSPSIGNPPNNTGSDWVAVVRDSSYNWTDPTPSVTVNPEPTATHTVKPTISASLSPTKSPFPTATPKPQRVCKADFNGDLRVDLIDRSILIQNYLSENPEPPSVDINQDGRVDLIDYSILIKEVEVICLDSTNPTATPSQIPSVTLTSTPVVASPAPATPTNTPVSNTGSALIQSLTVMNAQNDTEVSNHSAGQTITISRSQLPQFNIRVNANSSTRSVKIAYGSTSYFESTAPFAVGKDTNGDYWAWDIPNGQHTITLTPYTDLDGRGTVGTAVSFTLIVQDTGTVPTATPVPQTSGLSIQSLTLVNSSTDQDIMNLNYSSGTVTISKSQYPNINIRANVSGNPGSVHFEYGVGQRLETTAPYALAGNNVTDYHDWLISPGQYTVRVTPYKNTTATGEAGTPVSFTLNITN